jgi:hypothetical protein
MSAPPTRSSVAEQVAALATARGLRAYYDGRVKVIRQGEAKNILLEFPEWSDALTYFQSGSQPMKPDASK